MKISKKTLNNIFFLLGVAACLVMLFTFDVSFAELWHHICHAGYWLFPIVGVWAVVYCFNAMSWRSAIKGVLRNDGMAENEKMPSFWRIYRLTVTGYALNYATPVGGLGGEPYRIMELSCDLSKEHATSSVILYAMMHFFSHFWLWFTSIFMYLALVLIGDLPMNVVIGTALGIIVLLCFVAFYLFSKWYKQGVVVNLLGLIAHIPGLKKWAARMIDSHGDVLRNIDIQIASLLKQDKKAFYTSFFFEYFSRVITAFEILFMLLLFGVDCGGGITGIFLAFIHSILILSLTSLLANLVGFLPMQIGVQEGGFVVSIAAMRLSAALGIFVSIICRVREIIWIAIGMALMRMKSEE